MKYQNTLKAIFIDRPNRFIAHCKTGDITETVHVKNTGRCKELLLPGAEVILCEGNNPGRKTKYDLIAVYKKGLGLVNIDSQVPNAAVKEWLQSGGIEGITLIKPEYKYGNSRIDFYVECGERKLLIEVKGCTLEKEGVGYFPDAPTERGRKHLYELSKAVGEGFECYLAFVIAMPKVTKVLPNSETDPDFAKAIDFAEKSGVKILYLPCLTKEDELSVII